MSKTRFYKTSVCVCLVRGWLGWGSQFQQPIPKSKSMDERPSELPMELSIPDDRRCILSVTMSPLCNLAAMLDSFGRVMLLDCDNFTVRRMWKGMTLLHPVILLHLVFFRIPTCSVWVAQSE